MKVVSVTFGDSTRYEHYLTDKSALNYTGMLIRLSVLVFILICMIIQNKIKINGIHDSPAKIIDLGINHLSDETTAQINLLCISIFFYALTPIIGEFWRIRSYFRIYTVILLPNVVDSFKKKIINTCSVFLPQLCLLYIFFSSQQKMKT